MRPRVFPAEDDGDVIGRPTGRVGASMRPRVFPAEDDGKRPLGTARRPASMRPRVFPAEDASTWRCSSNLSICFNEAAGIPRGRLDAMDDPDAGSYMLQ